MTRGVFYDGRVAQAWPAEVRREGEAVAFDAAEGRFIWSFDQLGVATHAGETRLSHPSDRTARLLLTEADWRLLAGDRAEALRRRRTGSEIRLAAGLAVVGMGVLAGSIFGIPAASGPLARATPPAYEQGMGDNLNYQMSAIMPTCEGAEGQAVLAALGDRLTVDSDSPFEIQVRAVEAPFVNALALPGGWILITDDLIEEAESPDELAAVISHEIVHVQQRHVMQAVWRNLGIGLLLDAVVGGGSGAGQQAVILAGQMTELGYSREAEREADRLGQALLHRRGLTSQGMAPFFDRLAEAERGDRDETREDSPFAEFLATHPDTERRAREAREREQPGGTALTPQEWAAVRAACRVSDDPIGGVQRRIGIGNDAPRTGKPDQMGENR